MPANRPLPSATATPLWCDDRSLTGRSLDHAELVSVRIAHCGPCRRARLRHVDRPQLGRAEAGQAVDLRCHVGGGEVEVQTARAARWHRGVLEAEAREAPV